MPAPNETAGFLCLFDEAAADDGRWAAGVITQSAAAGLTSTAEPKGWALVRARSLIPYDAFPIWRGSTGPSTGCKGVRWDPRDPLS